jgi:superfamily I DNA/RNA helicase
LIVHDRILSGAAGRGRAGGGRDGCDDEVIPSQVRIDAIGDPADLEEVYATERHLLYVACTRARDHLLVAGVSPASEFLDDLES